MKKCWFMVLSCFILLPVFSQNLVTLDQAIDEYATDLTSRIPSNSNVAVIAFETDSYDLMAYFFDTMLEKVWEKGNGIRVYERQRLENHQQELNFSLSGAVSDETAQRIGHFVGVQTIIYGSMNRSGSGFRISIRASTVETGRILFPQSYDLRMDSRLAGLLRMSDQDLPAFAENSTPTDSWRNKWLYLRISNDFPITFYTLQPTGLFEGKLVYIGDPENPTWAAPIDNQVVAMPAITLGVEVRILNWLSVEPIFQIGWENLNDKDFINMSAGLTVNFPQFIRNVFLEPYAAVLFPLPISVFFMSFSPRSEIFDSFPLFGFGGGVQIGLRGGRTGIIFADISFMYYPGDVGMKNQISQAGIPPGSSNPQPETIHYRRYVIGLAIGYKFGLIDRK